jgi:MSHA biogenesis protein MshI
MNDQSVNLYTDKFRPRIDWLSLNRCVVYVLVVSLVPVMVSVQESLESSDLVAELVVQQDSTKQWRSNLSSIRAEIDKQSKDPQLEATIVQLQAAQSDKLTLRNFLRQGIPGNSDGFSAYLADLARFHRPGVQLTHVNLTGGGENIWLEGNTRSGELVTRYVDGLGRSDIFRGREFKHLAISRQAASQLDTDSMGMNILTFELATKGAVPR